MRDRDQLQFSLRNRAAKNGKSLDITLLYVQSDFGVVALYPIRQGDANRIESGATLNVTLPKINASTVGLEGVILIATEAEPHQPIANFAHLSQPGLLRVRGADPPAGDVTNDTLTALFEEAGFGETTRRGAPEATGRALSRTAMKVFSWKVEAARP